MSSMVLEYYLNQKYREQIRKENEKNAKIREEETEREIKETLNIINKHK